MVKFVESLVGNRGKKKYMYKEKYPDLHLRYGYFIAVNQLINVIHMLIFLPKPENNACISNAKIIFIHCKMKITKYFLNFEFFKYILFEI